VGGPAGATIKQTQMAMEAMPPQLILLHHDSKSLQKFIGTEGPAAGRHQALMFFALLLCMETNSATNCCNYICSATDHQQPDS
jgi:hypothetical protein